MWSGGDDLSTRIVEGNIGQIEIVESKVDSRGDEAIIIFFVESVIVLVYFLEVVRVNETFEGVDSGSSLVFVVAAAIETVLSVIEVTKDNGVAFVLLLV